MTHTITTSSGAIAPPIVHGYRVSRPARTIEHEIPGSPDSDFTLRPAGRRRGVLQAVFPDEASAYAALNWLSEPEVFSFATDALAGADMSFVVVQPGVTLEKGSAGEWVVDVPYSETS